MLIIALADDHMILNSSSKTIVSGEGTSIIADDEPHGSLLCIFTFSHC